MSSCRCSDIRNTENKIRKLESARGIITGQSGISEHLDDELLQWSGKAEQATVSAKITSAKGTMKTLGSGMKQAASGISGKINSKLGELNSSLNHMRHEDHEYHEEQRRRREEEERRKAEEAAKAASKNKMKW